MRTTSNKVLMFIQVACIAMAFASLMVGIILPDIGFRTGLSSFIVWLAIATPFWAIWMTMERNK